MLRCQQSLTHSRHRYLVSLTCTQHKPLRKKDVLRSYRRGRYHFASKTFEDYTLSRSSVILRIHSIADSIDPCTKGSAFPTHCNRRLNTCDDQRHSPKHSKEDEINQESNVGRRYKTNDGIWHWRTREISIRDPTTVLIHLR
jgi:hypothetical protein